MARRWRTVIREKPRTVAGVAAILAIYGVCLFSVIRQSSSDGVIGLVVLGVAAAVALVRIIRGGVLVTEDGIVIRNWVRSYPLPWSRISAFSPASDDKRNYTVGVLTTDGRRVSCSALRFLGGFSFVGPPRYEQLAAQNTAADRLADYIDRAERAGRLGDRTSAS